MICWRNPQNPFTENGVPVHKRVENRKTSRKRPRELSKVRIPCALQRKSRKKRPLPATADILR